MVSLEKGKRILFNQLLGWIKEKGFKYTTQGGEKFTKETDDWIYSIAFNFYENSTDHFTSTLMMHSKVVEGVILEVGMPNINLETYRKGENILYTLHDQNNLEPYMKKRAEINLEHESGYIEWADLIKAYMGNEAQVFSHQFSSLQNILLQIEDVEQRGLKNYLEIIVGGIDHLFRVLIISKLCGDENYHLRKKRFDHIVLQPKYSSWHPYYNKLITLLETKTSV